MPENFTLVITSIAGSDHPVLKLFAKNCARYGLPFILVGDTKSPARFRLEGCRFFDISRQQNLPFRLVKRLPKGHYARKNLGYLLAMSDKPAFIVETDDDNIPLNSFWGKRRLKCQAGLIEQAGWVNIYNYFCRDHIWPRGFALEHLRDEKPVLSKVRQNAVCPIQQGLADENPDVDAIYRLTSPLPVRFSAGPPIALGNNAWCPFNSQNTTWHPSAFPLLYLPSYCSFRLTDIWRSFIAQIICWKNRWKILFHKPTVRQNRNVHNLMHDFSDEIPGYINNLKIAEALMNLDLGRGQSRIAENMEKCYKALIKLGLVGRCELNLLSAWLEDVSDMSSR